MKVVTYIAFIVALLIACKKEKLNVPEMTGKWIFYGLSREFEGDFIDWVGDTDCFHGPYDDDEVGQVEMEVTEDGEFIFNSKKGTEKFQLAAKEGRTSIIKIFTCSSYTYTSVVVDGYNFTLRNKSGEKFVFPCFYIPSYDVLVTVPWVKGVLYNSTDRVYYESSGHQPFYHTTSYAYYKPGFYQYLGQFSRL